MGRAQQCGGAPGATSTVPASAAGPPGTSRLTVRVPCLFGLKAIPSSAKLFDRSTRIHRARLTLLQPAAAAAGEEIHWDTPAGRSVSSAVDVEGHTGLT